MIGNAVGRRSNVWGRERFFYSGMAVAVAAAVFAGFARTYYLRPHYQSSPLPLYLHVHGFVYTTWIALFIAQTMLVAARRVDVHRRLGWAGAAWSIVMVAAASTAAVLSGRRNVAAGNAEIARTFFAVPVFSIVVFIALVAGAVYFRRRSETHKRLMLLATISILDAAVARWPLAIVTARPWAFYAIADVFIVAAVAYDVVTRRTVSAAYVWGSLLIVGSQLARDAIGPTSAWHAFARQFIG